MQQKIDETFIWYYVLHWVYPGLGIFNTGQHVAGLKLHAWALSRHVVFHWVLWYGICLSRLWWMIVNDVCSDDSYINGYYNKYYVLLHLITLRPHFPGKQRHISGFTCIIMKCYWREVMLKFWKPFSKTSCVRLCIRRLWNFIKHHPYMLLSTTTTSHGWNTHRWLVTEGKVFLQSRWLRIDKFYKHFCQSFLYHVRDQHPHGWKLIRGK